MKNLSYSLMLCIFISGFAWAADSNNSEAVIEEHGINVTIDMNDDDVTDNTITEKELENKIKGKVFSIIADIIDAANDDISDEEKITIKDEIKQAIAEIKAAGDEISSMDIEDEGAHSIRIGSDDSGMFDDGVTFLEALIPLTAIIVVFGTPIMIVAGVLYTSYRKKKLMHETINKYVSSGKDIPPEVLQSLQSQVTPKSNLQRGLVWSGLGLGFFACFSVIGSIEAAAFGLIPLFIGLAQLLIWKLENK